MSDNKRQFELEEHIKQDEPGQVEKTIERQTARRFFKSTGCLIYLGLTPTYFL